MVLIKLLSGDLIEISLTGQTLNTVKLILSEHIYETSKMYIHPICISLVDNNGSAIETLENRDIEEILYCFNCVPEYRFDLKCSVVDSYLYDSGDGYYAIPKYMLYIYVRGNGQEDIISFIEFFVYGDIGGFTYFTTENVKYTQKSIGLVISNVQDKFTEFSDLFIRINHLSKFALQLPDDLKDKICRTFERGEIDKKYTFVQV